MKTLLFVCTGNTCRSPMAEEIFRLDVCHSDRKSVLGSVIAMSAGISAADGMPASRNAVAAISEIGGNICNFRSTMLSLELVKSANLVLTMTNSHKDSILRLFPYALGKVFTLKTDGDVLDPFGGDLDVYRRCRDDIRKAIHCLIVKLPDTLGL